MVAAGHATSVEDAFARYLSRGRPAYVPRQGLGNREALEAIVSAGGLAVLAHSADVVQAPLMLDRLQAWGLRGLEVYYGGYNRVFTPRRIGELARLAARRGLVASGGSDYHGDTMTLQEAEARTWVPRAAAEGLLEAIGWRGGCLSGRALPVLDMLPPSAGAGARQAMAEPALAEFVTEAVTQPAFHVWTLGCQMNHSDSEEMAGALLAAGCAEAEELIRPTWWSSTAVPSGRRPSTRFSSAAWASSADSRRPRHSGWCSPVARSGRTSTLDLRRRYPGGGPVPAPRPGARADPAAGTW